MGFICSGIQSSMRERRRCWCPCHDEKELTEITLCSGDSKCCAKANQVWNRFDEEPTPPITINGKQWRLIAGTFPILELAQNIRMKFGRICHFRDIPHLIGTPEAGRHLEVKFDDEKYFIEFLQSFCKEHNIIIQEMPV